MDGKNTILVVDDEPQMLESIKRILLMEGRYQVVTEQSASKVLVIGVKSLILTNNNLV